MYNILTLIQGYSHIPTHVCTFEYMYIAHGSVSLVCVHRKWLESEIRREGRGKREVGPGEIRELCSQLHLHIGMVATKFKVMMQ